MLQLDKEFGTGRPFRKKALLAPHFMGLMNAQDPTSQRGLRNLALYGISVGALLRPNSVELLTLGHLSFTASVVEGELRLQVVLAVADKKAQTYLMIASEGVSKVRFIEVQPRRYCVVSNLVAYISEVCAWKAGSLEDCIKGGSFEIAHDKKALPVCPKVVGNLWYPQEAITIAEARKELRADLKLIGVQNTEAFSMRSARSGGALMPAMNHGEQNGGILSDEVTAGIARMLRHRRVDMKLLRAYIQDHIREVVDQGRHVFGRENTGLSYMERVALCCPGVSLEGAVGPPKQQPAASDEEEEAPKRRRQQKIPGVAGRVAEQVAEKVLQHDEALARDRSARLAASVLGGETRKEAAPEAKKDRMTAREALCEAKRSAERAEERKLLRSVRKGMDDDCVLLAYTDLASRVAVLNEELMRVKGAIGDSPSGSLPGMADPEGKARRLTARIRELVNAAKRRLARERVLQEMEGDKKDMLEKHDYKRLHLSITRPVQHSQYNEYAILLADEEHPFRMAAAKGQEVQSDPFSKAGYGEAEGNIGR